MVLATEVRLVVPPNYNCMLDGMVSYVRRLTLGN
jgi:hypothetical protein